MTTNKTDPVYGSDVVADFLRHTGIPYIALNPGASFRGLHDSLVNHLGGSRPAMLMCLHEEHTVALAHGWAKVTGTPLAVAIHSNVGLMHASMAIYNAWCDRVPVFLLGATGPVDAALRRPWIDWIHTSSDQAALVRPFVKWDDQPLSVEATSDALARAWDIARAEPPGPTYVCLDAAVQEEALDRSVVVPRVSAGLPSDKSVASPQSIARALTLLTSAQRPVVLAGRVGRSEIDWQRRIELVEAIGARVVTDLKAGSSFPTTHPAHVSGPGFFLGAAGKEMLEASDCVLALDWIDPAGTLAQAPATGSRTLVNASLDQHLYNGWSKDSQARPEVDVWLATDPDTAVEQLLTSLDVPPLTKADASGGVAVRENDEVDTADRPISLSDIAVALRAELAGHQATLVRLPLGWNGDDWDFTHPLDFLGYDGGGGIGSGPGMLVGAALALRDAGEGRIPVGILGDGDYLMGVQALWTAAHDDIPFLAVVSNNRSYFNDEVHQEKVAVMRNRDVDRKWIGQRIDDPAPDLAQLARAQGLEGIGPITSMADLPGAFAEAMSLVRSGRPVVVDVVVRPGYSAAMSAGLTRELN
ncbi:thiamine pyrophosphate-binding protein [Rhodococcoides fascians A21d2]|uniref:thiamine pyrophosphate-binding protein n=1 Tax=Rhodococcoides fascians TaxID=1828 RepID=UPI000568CCFA|nr:thiamine pyrophosphate-binding protein [Rhodococcus fascians]QII00307.1 thiamine pyrophosphate-binding protein [Rhodococcus fascians A21d2]